MILLLIWALIIRRTGKLIPELFKEELKPPK